MMYGQDFESGIRVDKIELNDNIDTQMKCIYEKVCFSNGWIRLNKYKIDEQSELFGLKIF